MEVVILCGGQGTRIRDVAEDIPKPMIPIGDRPILWHIMRRYAYYGFKDFILCLGYKSWVVKQFFLHYHLSHSDLRVGLSSSDAVEILDNGAWDDWNVTLAETGLSSMTGCRLKRVAKYIRSDNFMLTYGDGVADVDISSLVHFHHAHGKIGTVTAVTPPGRFGEMELNGPVVSEFSEKPLLSRGRINGGFFVFKRQFLDRLSDEEELVLERSPLQTLARDGELGAYLHDGFWQCMDNSRDFQYLNHLWSTGQAVWEPSSFSFSRRAA